MERLYLILPAYNEAANLAAVVADWYPMAAQAGTDSRLVIVDDGSRDETPALLARLSNSFPQLVVLSRPNGGHGPAIYQGYQFALAQGADYIFQTDSDGQTNPEDFWPLWETRDTYAYQIGWRRRREDGLSRKLVSWTLRQTILICCRIWLPDANAPFRLLRASALAACLEQISPTCPLTNVWLSILLAAGGFPGRFYPISFRPRQGGVNSLNLRRIAPIGLQAAKDLWALGHTLNR